MKINTQNQQKSKNKTFRDTKMLYIFLTLSKNPSNKNHKFLKQKFTL